MSTKLCVDNCGTLLDALHMSEKDSDLCEGCAEKILNNFDLSADPEVANLTNEDMDYQIKGLRNGSLHFWKAGYVKKNIDEWS